MKIADFRSRQYRLLTSLLITLPIAAILPYCFGNIAWGMDITRAALIFAIFALSWDFLCGATGEISFGHSFFVGASAYTAALVEIYGGFSPFAALVAAALTGATCGALLGLLTLKHTAAVFTMITMAIQLSFYRTLFISSGLFGGEEGLVLPGGLITNPQGEFWLTLGISIGALLFSLYLWDTPFGRQLRASGGDNRIALASGVPVARIRVLGTLYSGLLAGLGGGLLAMLNHVAHHELAGDSLAGLIFLLSTVGGVRTLLGPWLTALLYTTIGREFFQSFQEIGTILEFGMFLIIIWAFPRGFSEPLGAFWRSWRFQRIHNG